MSSLFGAVEGPAEVYGAVPAPESREPVKIEPEDIQKVVDALPVELRLYLEKTPGLVVAGGFVRSVVFGDLLNDIDVFRCTELGSPGHDYIHVFGSNEGYGIENESYNAVTYSSPKEPLLVQFVWRLKFENLRDIPDNGFDYSVCCAQVYFKNGQWTGDCHSEWYEDNEQKLLHFSSKNADMHGSNHLARLNKYIAKGFTINRPNLNEVATSYVRKLAKKAGLDDLNTQALFDVIQGTNKDYY